MNETVPITVGDINALRLPLTIEGPESRVHAESAARAAQVASDPLYQSLFRDFLSLLHSAAISDAFRPTGLEHLERLNQLAEELGAADASEQFAAYCAVLEAVSKE